MKKHPTHVQGYEGELASLAQQVSAMRYDLVIEFYEHSVAELRRQAAGDRVKGRTQTAAALEESADELEKFIIKMQRVWRICEPYMKKELEP